MKPHAVLIPSPAQGHISPFLKLAKLLHSRGFFITFVNTDFNHTRLVRTRGPESVQGLQDFQFRTIPDGLPFPDKVDATQDISLVHDSLSRNGHAPFFDLVRTLNDSPDCPDVSCIVSDGAMSFTLDTADLLGIPEVVFFTTSACGLMGYCNYHELVTRGLFPLKDLSQLTDGFLETELDWVPGMKHFRLRNFPSFMRTTNPDDFMVNFNILQTKNASRARAVVINTFDDLEKEVLDALRQQFGTVCTIGPLHLLEQDVRDPEVRAIGSSLWKEDDASLAWLEQREPGSVLYVNFGSITVVSPEQLREFAWGLANSNQSFLWIIRPDIVSGDSAILPPEYLAEVAERALMVGWCAQERVLSHPSVGGFLTHSGWNSTLEALTEGVPMISWPFFAEQPTNCRYVCTDWAVGLELEGEVERGKVAALVKLVMEGEKGKELRKNAATWKKKAHAVVAPGGSSRRNLDFLLEDILLKD